MKRQLLYSGAVLILLFKAVSLTAAYDSPSSASQDAGEYRKCKPCPCPKPLDPCPTLFPCTGPTCPKSIYSTIVKRLCIKECLKVGQTSWLKGKVIVGCQADDNPICFSTGCPNALLCVNGNACIQGNVCVAGNLFATGQAGPPGPPGDQYPNFRIEDNVVNTAMAVGSDAIASGKQSLAMGFESVAVGDQAISNSSSSISIGFQAFADGANAIAIGRDTTAQDINSFNIGGVNNGSIEASVVIGGEVVPSMIGQRNNVAIGYSSITLNLSGNTTVGYDSACIGANNVALGYQAVATSELLADTNGGVAVGLGARAGEQVENGTVAVGVDTRAFGEGSIAVGFEAETFDGGIFPAPDFQIALGYQAFANGAAAIAIGDLISNTIDESLIVGTNGVPYMRLENPTTTTQPTSNSTPVAIDASQGFIEMADFIPFGTSVGFDVTNNRVAADSIILLSSRITNDSFEATPVAVTNIVDGGFRIDVNNINGNDVGLLGVDRRIYFWILNPSM